MTTNFSGAFEPSVAVSKFLIIKVLPIDEIDSSPECKSWCHVHLPLLLFSFPWGSTLCMIYQVNFRQKLIIYFFSLVVFLWLFSRESWYLQFHKPTKTYQQHWTFMLQIHLTSLDFTLLSAFAPFWVYNDMTARKWWASGNSWVLLSHFKLWNPLLEEFM